MLRMDNQNWVLLQDQRIAPADLTRCKPFATVWWHVTEILFKRARLGLESLLSMSLHLSSIYAKLPVAGPKGAKSHKWPASI